MGQVSASSTVLIDAEPEPLLRQPRITRPGGPKFLSLHYSHYRVLEGRAGRRAGVLLRTLRVLISAESDGFFMLPSSRD
jgi:hypothetical protein